VLGLRCDALFLFSWCVGYVCCCFVGDGDCFFLIFFRGIYKVLVLAFGRDREVDRFFTYVFFLFRPPTSSPLFFTFIEKLLLGSVFFFFHSPSSLETLRSFVVLFSSLMILYSSWCLLFFFFVLAVYFSFFFICFLVYFCFFIFSFGLF